MEPDLNEYDMQAWIEKMQRLLLEIQPQPPPPPPSKWEQWLQKSGSGISQALVVDILWPTGFWHALGLFGVAQPFTVGIIIKGLVANYCEGQWTSAALGQYFDALLVFSGYVATLLLLRMVYYFFASIRHLLGVVWRHPSWTCAVGAALLGLRFLMRMQLMSLTRLRIRFYASLLSLVLGASSLYLRGGRLPIKLRELAKRSRGLRICKLYLKRGGLWILGHASFDRLEAFTYPSLPPGQRQVRLLLLHRQIPFFDLKAELVCCPLDAAPPYEAISYVWGADPRKPHPVILDNKQFHVSTNVFHILCRHSSLFRPRLLWIDSICINQSDDVEKSQQVKMMRDIYETASRVVVCLGENPDAWLALGMLNQLMFMKSFKTQKAWAEDVFNYFRMKDSNELLDAQLTAFLDLLHHEWFDRVWVIQEVVVARSITVLYGNRQVAWESFTFIMETLVNHDIAEVVGVFQHSGESGVTRPVPLGETQAAFMAGYREKFKKGQFYPLYDALRLFLAFKATKPRDKIFALLGLTESASDLNHIIDYKRSMSSILLEVADFILEKGYLLEVFHLAGIGWERAEADLPSWVVDWGMSRDPTSLAHSCHEDHLQYRAAIQRRSVISRGNDKRHIRVRGQFIDCIREIGSTMGGPDMTVSNRPLEGLDDIIVWMKEAEDLAHKYAVDPYYNGQSLSEVVWRTVIGDRTWAARPAPREYGVNIAKMKEALHALKSIVAVYGTDLNGLKEHPPDVDPLKGSFPTWDSLKAFMRDMYNVAWLCGQPSFPRSFAVTNEGYVAMVPKGTRSGDIICTIWGAQVPFVLRSRGSTADGRPESYHLVGECYVHGMMDGECFQLHSEAEDFELV